MKNNKAITLIALVITIIILLILAGATMGFAMSGSGLFEKAKLATDKYNNAAEVEDSTLYNLINDKSIVSDREASLSCFAKIEDTEEVENYVYSEENKIRTFTAPQAGYYRIELWGAQGGSYKNAAGGKGAYTCGIIHLEKDDTIYIYLGECYNGGKTTMTFNGGGSSSNSSDPIYCVGGGATDVRLINGDWDNFDSLKSRIMVAAGGGGSTDRPNDNWPTPGAAGGALVGRTVSGKVFAAYSGYSASYKNAVKCTQTSPGEAPIGYNNGSIWDSGACGTFGKGGSGGSKPGGGGGYYGGASGCVAPWAEMGGSGGNSYISGYDGCNSISSESSEDNIIHTNRIIHYSGKYFLYTKMFAGDDHMPSYSNKNEEIIGNDGQGKARITRLNVE